jgi:hypothetical protein
VNNTSPSDDGEPSPPLAPSVPAQAITPRSFVLRDERDGEDWRFLRAYLRDGDLVLEGQDLGPATATVSNDGEYEYFETVKAADLPQLLHVLGEPADADILEVLARSWRGSASYELEERLRHSGVPVQLFVYGG